MAVEHRDRDRLHWKRDEPWPRVDESASRALSHISDPGCTYQPAQKMLSSRGRGILFEIKELECRRGASLFEFQRR